MIGTELSFADITLATMLVHLSLARFDLAPFPKLQAFMAAVQQHPSFAVVHEGFHKLTARK